MSVTFQQLIDRARLDWSDADKDRYLDDDALVAANSGVNEMLLLRPDIFFGSLGSSVTDGTYVLVDPVPIDTRYTQVLQDWITHRMEYGEDEAHNSGRAMSARTFFKERLMT